MTSKKRPKKTKKSLSSKIVRNELDNWPKIPVDLSGDQIKMLVEEGVFYLVLTEKGTKIIQDYMISEATKKED